MSYLIINIKIKVKQQDIIKSNFLYKMMKKKQTNMVNCHKKIFRNNMKHFLKIIQNNIFIN